MLGSQCSQFLMKMTPAAVIIFFKLLNRIVILLVALIFIAISLPTTHSMKVRFIVGDVAPVIEF